MKKLLILIAMMLPGWIAAQSVTYNKSWVEYDVVRNGELGMVFYYDVNIYDCRNKELYVNTSIEDSNHQWVKSYNDNYKASSDGSVFNYFYFTPSYNNSHWEDMDVFIPYSAMPLAEKGKTYSYTSSIGFRYKSDGNRIKQSPFYTLDWASHSPSAKIDKIWVDHNYKQDNQNGMLIHADVSVYNYKDKNTEFVCFFYDSNGNSVKTTNSTYAAQGGAAHVRLFDKPNYANSRWSDFKMFIPYSVFPNTPGRSDYTFYYYVRDPGRNYAVMAQSSQQTFYINNASNCDKPGIEWLSAYDANTASFEVRAGITSKTEVTSTNITVNGNAYRGMKTVKNDGYQMRLNETVTLREGTNEIVLSATNSCGTTTKTYRVTYTKPYTEPVYAQKRVALVIGNANYKSHPLGNPINDANDVSATLRSLGFEVRTLLNAKLRDMDQAVADLSNKSDKNTVALFYYAGHGIQKDGCNYLIPVDADPQKAADLPYVCYDVNRVLANMEESGCEMNIVILDACRDDPFGRSWSRSSSNKGFATLDISGATGTFISYATSPGKEALDGDDGHSPYARAFINALNTPGLELQYFFRTVQSQVKKSTGGVQVPWNNSSVTGDFYFNPK